MFQIGGPLGVGQADQQHSSHRRRVREELLSLYFTHPAVQDWFSRDAGGTAIRSVNTRTLGSLPVSLPPPATQRAIGRTLDALNEKIAAHEQILVRSALLIGRLPRRSDEGRPAPPLTGQDTNVMIDT